MATMRRWTMAARIFVVVAISGTRLIPARHAHTSRPHVGFLYRIRGRVIGLTRAKLNGLGHPDASQSLFSSLFSLFGTDGSKREKRNRPHHLICSSDFICAPGRAPGGSRRRRPARATYPEATTPICLPWEKAPMRWHKTYPNLKMAHPPL